MTTGGVTTSGRVRPTIISILLGLVLVATTLAGQARAADDGGEDGGFDGGFETSDFSTACPELSDSVYRLYTAYFGRVPDAVGFEYWLTTYAQGGAGLETMSQAFADSEEFVQTYGELANDAFIELIYANVLGRQPDAAGFAHWVGALDGGYSRGRVMIAFSESQEYVIRTRTTAPLAGWLSWYDSSVQFACGQGDGNLPAAPMPAFADVIVWNLSSTTESTVAWGVDTPTGVYTANAVLPPRTYQIWWGVELEVLEVSNLWMDVDANPDLFWSMVVFDQSPGDFRPPYTDGLGSPALRLGGSAPDPTTPSWVDGWSGTIDAGPLASSHLGT